MSSPVAGTKPPVWATVGRAYGCVFRNIGRLIVLASIPFTLTLMGILAATLLVNWKSRVGVFTGTILLVCSFCISPMIFAVAWHRFVILGWESHAAGPRVRFGMREAKYLGVVCVACTPVAIAGALTALPIPVMSPLALIVVAGCLFPRLAMVFPAAALDRTLSVRSSWARTRGVAARLSVMLLIPTLVYAGLLSIPAWAPGDGAALVANLLVPYVVVHYILWVAVMATVLSLTFAHLEGEAITNDLKRPADSAGGGDDVLMWNLDRDFGWLYIALMSPAVVAMPWLGWSFRGWGGIAAAILPCVMLMHSLACRAAMLLEDSAVMIDRETLRARGRFGEMLVFLKDIREVSLRRILGATYVCVTFADLDSALAHRFVVPREPLTVPYTVLWRIITVLGYTDALNALIRMLKGDISVVHSGRQIDLYKEGSEQYFKDGFRRNFKDHGFHLSFAPIFRNRSNLDLAREIDRRRQAAKMLT